MQARRGSAGARRGRRVAESAAGSPAVPCDAGPRRGASAGPRVGPRDPGAEAQGRRREEGSDLQIRTLTNVSRIPKSVDEEIR